jgi:histidinol-phosphatase
MQAARQAVDAAAAASVRFFRTDVRVELKIDRSPVTQADKDAEVAILEVLRRATPDAAFLTEESGALPGRTGLRWIVDPLDGTRGFTRGGAFWGPLVALEHEGELVAGAMGLPALGTTYWGALGLGAYRNGQPLELSRIREWSEATLSLGEMPKIFASTAGNGARTLMGTAAQTRCYGDLAACAMLLDGRAEAWIEAGVQLWDLAALKVLVESAGGRFTDFTGTPTAATGNALATNGLVHDHVLAAIR